jgi:AAA ATPase domain
LPGTAKILVAGCLAGLSGTRIAGFPFLRVKPTPPFPVRGRHRTGICRDRGRNVISGPGKLANSPKRERAMKLSAVHIQNFRSVKDAIVEDIDDFNVFIGKNNSGKSNLLSAIHAFFRILSNGSLVSSQPVIGKLSDFTEKVSSHPISITARFVLSREETIKILTMMREERPQIATALEALPEDLSLSIRISILPPPQAYSFVEEITLASFSEETRNWLLLKVDLASAEELYRNDQEDQGAQRMRETAYARASGPSKCCVQNRNIEIRSPPL